MPKFLKFFGKWTLRALVIVLAGIGLYSILHPKLERLTANSLIDYPFTPATFDHSSYYTVRGVHLAGDYCQLQDRLRSDYPELSDFAGTYHVPYRNHYIPGKKFPFALQGFEPYSLTIRYLGKDQFRIVSYDPKGIATYACRAFFHCSGDLYLECTTALYPAKVFMYIGAFTKFNCSPQTQCDPANIIPGRKINVRPIAITSDFSCFEINESEPFFFPTTPLYTCAHELSTQKPGMIMDILWLY